MTEPRRGEGDEHGGYRQRDDQRNLGAGARALVRREEQRQQEDRAEVGHGCGADDELAQLTFTLVSVLQDRNDQP